MTVTYNLESLGLQILLFLSVGFGAVAQLIMGDRATRWLWLIAGVAWFVGGLVASEVIVGTMTEAEIQPIVGGLAFDEALLGGLLTGVVAVAATWLYAHPSVERRMADTPPRIAVPH